MIRFKPMLIRCAICSLIAAAVSLALVRVHPFSGPSLYAVSGSRVPNLVMHWNAQSGDDNSKLLNQRARAQQTGSSDALDAVEGDPKRGRVLFEKRCTGCHSLTQNREGPQLQGVYGRLSGTAEGFVYSAALNKAQVVWDAPSLEKWLTDPDAFIPGNEMDFLVAKPQERKDLIGFLRQVSGK